MCCVPAMQEKGGWLPCYNSLLALGITAEMYSSLSVNKIELKIKIAGISAIQVTSMESSPTCLLLAAAHSVGVPWLACACYLAVRVCHLFSMFNVCKLNQIQAAPAVPCSRFLLWYSQGLVVAWGVVIAAMLSIVQAPVGGFSGTAGCSSRPGYKPHHQL